MRQNSNSGCDAFLNPHCGSVRIDETYVKIRGKDRYLYKAIDKNGEAVDFLFTAKRDVKAAKRVFRKALKETPLFAPDSVGTGGAKVFPAAIKDAEEQGYMKKTPSIASNETCGKSDVSRASEPQLEPSKDLKPCFGSKKASVSLENGPFKNRMNSLQAASDFKCLTKRKIRLPAGDLSA